MSERSEEDLLSEFAPLVAWTVRVYAPRLRGTIHETGDLEVAVGIALVKAARSYDASQGAAMKSWLITAAHNGAREFVREARRAGRRYQAAQIPASQLGTADEPFDAESLLPPSPSAEDVARAMLLTEALHAAFSGLPPRERIVLLVQLAGGTIQDAACEIGVSGSRAFQLKNRAQERLRRALADWE